MGYIVNQVVCGDAFALGAEIISGSVDLIFTDPIYDASEAYIWLGKTARRILKPDGAVLCWSSGHWHKVNVEWLEIAGLKYRWDFACMINSGLSPMDGKIISKTNRLIWMDIDRHSRLLSYIPDGFIAKPWLRRGQNTEHRWTKSPVFTQIALKAFTRPGDLVYDPFCGGGTIPIICKEMERNFIAGEIDAETARKANERLSHTNVPIGLEVQQLNLIDQQNQIQEQTDATTSDGTCT